MRRALALATALLVIVAPALDAGRAPARAQDAGTTPVDEAARAFAEASSAFDAGRFDEALKGFRRAYTLAPHDRVRFNIAVVLEELGRFREAAVEYDAVGASHQLDDDIRARARAASQGARARLATLEIRSAGRALEVDVDGAAACTTPCEIEIDPGEHTIAYRTGARPVERRVRAVSGARLAIALEVATAEPRAPRRDTRAPTPSDEGGIDLGLAGAIGLGVTAAGTAGTIAFGLRAKSIYDEYQTGGCAAVSCDEGDLMTTLTNVSIAVLVAGAIAVAVDLLFIDD